jgi:glycosyltransferase involved in cell wall biosynthesis
MVRAFAMKARLLVVRNFARPSGGNVTVRDFFGHALAHPRIDAHVYFPPGSRHAESDVWSDVPPDRVVEAPDWHARDFVLVNGKDWRLLPPDHDYRIIHLVQHLGYADDPELRGYLARPALRICLSDAAQETIGPHAIGPSCVIPSGVDPALFFEDDTRRRGLVLVWGGKDADTARAIAERLGSRGVHVEVICEPLPRAVFASRLRAADVFVALPRPCEGFFRPPLEAMACGCVVVCSDARGNRAHCVAGHTCWQPPHGDVDAHVAAVCHLLANDSVREHLRHNGRTLARDFDIGVERRRVHAVFDRLIDG